MARLNVTSQNINEGKIIYNSSIVEDIVLLAVTEIPYVKLTSDPSAKKVLRSSAVKVSNEKDGIHVDVSAKIHYTQSVSDMAFKIQEAIRHNVEAMTEYHVVSVNVAIRGVLFDDDPIETTVQDTNLKTQVSDTKKEDKWEV